MTPWVICNWKYRHGLLLSGIYRWARIYHMEGLRDGVAKCPWTNCGDRCTYRNHNIHTCTHACLSRHLGRVCVWTVRSRAVWDTWQAAGNGRGRCIKTREAKLEKERKKYCGTKIRRQEKEKQNILLRKVQTIRHSWWHPQRSISCSDPGTTWKLISFVSSGKQSQQTCPTPETHAGTHTNSNLCLSQSGTKGNEISKVSITVCHTSAEMTAPGQIRLGNTRVTLT